MEGVGERERGVVGERRVGWGGVGWGSNVLRLPDVGG